MNKTLLPVFALAFLFVAVPGSARAEGELAWQYNGAPASNRYTDVAVSADGVFVPSRVSWGEIAVERRSADNSGGWKKTFAAPVGSWSNGDAHIAADATGVYVAASTAITIDLNDGNLALVKLSPVDGSIIQLTNSISPGYVNVTNVEVDSTGVYVAGGSSNNRGYGGTSWRLEKWQKDLSVRTWGYSSKQSGGNASDYWGPICMAMNTSSVYLGGSRLINAGIVSAHIEKVNKSTGVSDWVRLEAWGTPVIGSMALSDTNLYTASIISIWSGALSVSFASYTHISKLEKRPLDNNPALWAVYTPDLTTALVAEGTGLYRGYVPNGDNPARTRVDKRSFLDGQQIGTTTIASSVVMAGGEGIFSWSIINNMSIDASGIYIAGKDEKTPMWGVPNSARIEKYNHFGPVTGACGPANGVPTATAPTPTPATPPNNLCTSGTTSTVTDAGASFAWTCDGPDGIPATADDAACSALKPATLKLCLSTCGSGSTNFNGGSITLNPNEIRNIRACYNASSSCDTNGGDVTDDATTVFSATDVPADAVSLTATKGQVQANATALGVSEIVNVSYGAIPASVTFSVPIICAKNCSNAPNICQGQTFNDANNCGTNNCTGTRYCDFNWKEVAP